MTSHSFSFDIQSKSVPVSKMYAVCPQGGKQLRITRSIMLNRNKQPAEVITCYVLLSLCVWIGALKWWLIYEEYVIFGINETAALERGGTRLFSCSVTLTFMQEDSDLSNCLNCCCNHWDSKACAETEQGTGLAEHTLLCCSSSNAKSHFLTVLTAWDFLRLLPLQKQSI